MLFSILDLKYFILYIFTSHLHASKFRVSHFKTYNKQNFYTMHIQMQREKESLIISVIYHIPPYNYKITDFNKYADINLLLYINDINV